MMLPPTQRERIAGAIKSALDSVASDEITIHQAIDNVRDELRKQHVPKPNIQTACRILKDYYRNIMQPVGSKSLGFDNLPDKVRI